MKVTRITAQYLRFESESAEEAQILKSCFGKMLVPFGISGGWIPGDKNTGTMLTVGISDLPKSKTKKKKGK